MITARMEYKYTAADDARGWLLKARRALSVRPFKMDGCAEPPFDAASLHISIAIAELNAFLINEWEEETC